MYFSLSNFNSSFFILNYKFTDHGLQIHIDFR